MDSMLCCSADDHCKHPAPRGDLGPGIDPQMLVDYVRAQAAEGTVDPLHNLQVIRTTVQLRL